MENVINITGVIGSDYTSAMLIADLKRFNNPNKVTLKIDSGGGDLRQAEAMVNHLEGLDVEITTINNGFVGSSATYLYLAGHTRLAMERSVFMFHYPKIQGMRDFSTDELDILALEWEKEKEQMRTFYLSKMNITDLDARTLLANDNYLGTEDAYTLGITTEKKPIPFKIINNFAVVAFGGDNFLNMSLNKKLKSIVADAKLKSIVADAKLRASKKTTALKATLTDERVLEFVGVDEGEEITEGVSVKFDDGTKVDDGDYTLKNGDKVTIESEKVKVYEKETDTEADASEELEMLADEIAETIREAVEEAVEVVIEEKEAEILAYKNKIEELKKRVTALSKPPKTTPTKTKSATAQASAGDVSDLSKVLNGARDVLRNMKKK